MAVAAAVAVVVVVVVVVVATAYMSSAGREFCEASKCVGAQLARLLTFE